MEYIKRSIEDVIRKSAKSFKVVLVTGARQKIYIGETLVSGSQRSDL